jgi:hypothetical protein
VQIDTRFAGRPTRNAKPSYQLEHRPKGNTKYVAFNIDATNALEAIWGYLVYTKRILSGSNLSGEG